MLNQLRKAAHRLVLHAQLIWERSQAQRCAGQCCDQHRYGMHEDADHSDIEAQCHWRRARKIMRELRG